MGLSENFIKRMKKKLEKRREEILETLDDLIKRSDADNDIAMDEGDKSLIHYSLHYLSQLSSRELKTFKAIEVALKKIEKGTYGICEYCGKEINPKRIEAIPWAKYCVECQEKIEKGYI